MASFTEQPLVIDTNGEFIIKQIDESIFQIGEIFNIQNEFLQDFKKTLNLGAKFVPCFHLSKFEIFKNLLVSLNDSFLDINKTFFFNLNSKCNLVNSIEAEMSFNLEFVLRNFFNNCDNLECFFKDLRKLKSNFKIRILLERNSYF